MKVEVRGLKLNHGHNPLKHGRVLCTAEVNLPDVGIGISDILLCWGEERGFSVLPPLARGGVNRAVHWKNDSDIARALVAGIKAAYRNMGGEMPDAKPKPVPFRTVEEIDASIIPASEIGLNLGLARTLGVA
jgi:hypothetical protein